MTDKYIKRMQGFTLVELSIVIIIIGFLIAGVSAGQSLIKQAQLNAIINDLTKFTTAYNGFKARFNETPGDLLHAYSFWGTAGNCTDTYVNDVPHDGCNGNGDGNLGPTNQNYEGVMMWKHLQLAGYIAGNYSGTRDLLTGAIRIGTDVPASVINGSGFYATYDSYYDLVSTQDMLGFGSGIDADPYGPVLKPAEAKQIDQKIDDGLPVTGRVFSGTSPWGFSYGQCVNGTSWENLTDATEYVLDNDQVACRMVLAILTGEK